MARFIVILTFSRAEVAAMLALLTSLLEKTTLDFWCWSMLIFPAGVCWAGRFNTKLRNVLQSV